MVHHDEHFTNAEMFLGDLVYVNEIAQAPTQPDQAVVVADRLIRVFHHDAHQVMTMARGEAGQGARAKREVLNNVPSGWGAKITISRVAFSTSLARKSLTSSRSRRIRCVGVNCSPADVFLAVSISVIASPLDGENLKPSRYI